MALVQRILCHDIGVAVNAEYRTGELGVQKGVDRHGQPSVSFDYTALDLPAFLGDPAFRRFLEALDHMARGIALEMFVTVLARHSSQQMKAFEMRIRGMSSHQIGDELNVDHKTAQRWYEAVGTTIREISPLGRTPNPSSVEEGRQECPKNEYM